jgi:hypothetical protein
MKVCPACNRSVDDDPYRSQPINYKSHSNKQRIINYFRILFKWILDGIIGLLVVGLCIVAFWIPTFGCFKLGRWFANDKMGWDLPTDWGPSPAPIIVWFVGVVLLIGWTGFPALGRWALSQIKERIQ